MTTSLKSPKSGSKLCAELERDQWREVATRLAGSIALFQEIFGQDVGAEALASFHRLYFGGEITAPSPSRPA